MTTLVTYPGIRQILRASYTLAHGITPGVCEIECAPQAEPIGPAGTLTLACDGTTLVFPHCRTDLATARRTVDGLVWSVAILDRRWRWAFGAISGEYNRRDASDRTIPEQNWPIIGVERTPQQLARLLLQAMGEAGFDVSRLPNATRPWVRWDAETPAQELAQLADDLGCRIVLHLDGHVSLEPLGQGLLLPVLATLVEGSLTVDPPEPPDSFLVIGGPTRVQTRLDLEAVGLDLDGSIQRLDDLSYTPDNGWSAQTELFSDVTQTAELANCLRTVFRWYRVRIDAEHPLQIPQVGRVTELAQILPLEKQLVETYVERGERLSRQAQVTGDFWLENLGSPENSLPAAADSEAEEARQTPVYAGSWRLLAEQGIVEFAHPVRHWDDDAEEFVPADLQLECAFGVRLADTGAPHRLEFEWPTGSQQGTGPAVLRRERELVLQTFETFNNEGHSIGWQTERSSSGGASLEDEAQRVVTTALQAYQTSGAGDATYAGFVPLDPDGAIVQVTWTVGPKPFTRACRNSETHPRIPPYRTRRLYERLRYSK